MKKLRITGINILLLLAAAVLLCGCLLLRGCGEKTQEEAQQIFIRVLMPDESTAVLPLEDFLCGVVAAEMPANFGEEALMAQTVAARTYILSCCPPYGEGRHGDATVCCDSHCCQAWISKEQMKQKWGDQYEEKHERISEAVQATAGQILTWQGKPAETPFCSCCGGSTESAADCWGGSYPYLKAVTCGYCNHATRYWGGVTLSLREAAEKLQVKPEDLYQMQTVANTAGYRVKTVQVGSKSCRGTEIRSLLGLNSAAFTWLICGETVVFFTIGYGHGVGLCQYGADGMAQQGYDHRQILEHYYPGTEISSIGEG